jgi:hypothetical protein
MKIENLRNRSVTGIALIGIGACALAMAASCDRVEALLSNESVPKSECLASPPAASTTTVELPEASYSVTALAWAATQGRLWCLENAEQCRKLSVYKGTRGDYQMMIDVRVAGETSIEDMQRSALKVADHALIAAFSRMEDHAGWLQLVEIVVRDTPNVIMSRVSLEGRDHRPLSTRNSRVAWVTGERDIRPASDETPVSTPWVPGN